MRKYFYCFLLLYTTLSFSQIGGGEVIYKISQSTNFTESLQKENRTSTHSLVTGLSEHLKDIELSLVFNTDNSTFYTLKEAPMTNSGNPSKMQEFAINIAHTGNYFRRAGESGVFYKPNSFFDSNITVHYQDFEWELKDDQKKIGNYICYKVTSSRIVKNLKGNFTHAMVAWYCPGIAVGYGPSRYGGLPGLILEIDDGEMVYKAINIEFKNKMPIPELKNKKITLVSEEEYEQLLLKKIGDFKKLMAN